MHMMEFFFLDTNIFVANKFQKGVLKKYAWTLVELVIKNQSKQFISNWLLGRGFEMQSDIKDSFSSW